MLNFCIIKIYTTKSAMSAMQKFVIIFVIILYSRQIIFFFSDFTFFVEEVAPQETHHIEAMF